MAVTINDSIASLREQLILAGAVLLGFKDWVEIAACASNEKYSDIRVKDNIQALAMQWKSRPRIIKAFEDAEFRMNALTDKARREGAAAANISPNKGKRGDQKDESIDFTDRETFLKFINSKLNFVEDEKQRMDLLKMMSDLLRFKEDKPADGSLDIQRFYTPMQCLECPMYKKEQEALE